jgi:inhibitor of cysteine peptidase
MVTLEIHKGAIMDRRRWYRVGIGATLLVLVLALVAALATGCGDSGQAAGGPLRLGETDNGKSCTVGVGETIEVAIAGNPTTGYEWTAALSDEDAALLEQVGDPVYSSDTTESNIVGAGGTYTFTFKAAATGEATLKLVYARPWESVQPLQTYEVKVTID